MKYAFRTGDGGRLSVILHNDGQREIYYYRRGDDDEPTAVIDAPRRRGAAARRGRSAAPTSGRRSSRSWRWRSESSTSSGCPCPTRAPRSASTLADCGLRAKTGVTVIAILREPEPVSGAQPEDVHPAGRHARRRRQGRAVRALPAAARRGPVRRVGTATERRRAGQAWRARTRASIAGRSAPATSR